MSYLTGHRERQMSAIRVGIFPPFGLLDDGAERGGAERGRSYLAQVADAGISHVCCADHISFGGTGFDGLIQATALAMLHPSLGVSCSLYLLPLRHPVPVARQLADIERLAPGRLTFGVGIGGEDRREVAMCGVDPATRGRRMDECLTVLRELATGAPVSFRGEFFELDQAVITPPAPVPVVVGGRSDAAVRRAGRLGDGWLGIWVSPRRFAAATELAAAEAARAGRPAPSRHAMQVWCGIADTREAARACVAGAMEGFYGLPFERFERYCPYGTAADVAEFLAGYVAAGCTEFNLLAQSPDPGQAIAATAEVARRLRQAVTAPVPGIGQP
jgi:alkanesulfonate monooxygenase SsuD/methylene tetrahydromethanopterin reductase-like flavin-dependent oxidoreductase (luciferase family)